MAVTDRRQIRTGLASNLNGELLLIEPYQYF